jgi:hypothetical protein
VLYDLRDAMGVTTCWAEPGGGAKQ